MALIGWMVLAVMVSCLLYDELLQEDSAFFYAYLLYTRRLAREEDLLVIPLHTYLDKHIQYILIDIL